MRLVSGALHYAQPPWLTVSTLAEEKRTRRRRSRESGQLDIRYLVAWQILEKPSGGIIDLEELARVALWHFALRSKFSRNEAECIGNKISTVWCVESTTVGSLEPVFTWH